MNPKQSLGAIIMMASYAALILLMDWPKDVHAAWIFLNVIVFSIGYAFTLARKYPQ